MKNMLIIVAILACGCTSVKPYDDCERQAIEHGKRYVYSVKFRRYIEVKSIDDEITQEELEKELDVQEGDQEF